MDRAPAVPWDGFEDQFWTIEDLCGAYYVKDEFGLWYRIDGCSA